MQITDAISGILANLLRTSAPPIQKGTVQNSSTSTTTGANGTTAVQSSSASELTTSTTSTTTGIRDYTRMTPREMKEIAQGLYDSGKIDLTQLLMLQTAGVPLGRMGPDGEYIPLSTTERSGYENTPVNYLQISQDAIKNLEKTGGKSDPKSGYAQWTGILAALRQTSTSIDVQA